MHFSFSVIALQMISFGDYAHSSSFDGQYAGVMMGSHCLFAGLHLLPPIVFEFQLDIHTSALCTI